MDRTHLKYTLSWIALVVMIFILIYVTTIFDVIGQYGLTTLVLIGINLIAAVGLNLVIGMSGQFSLGHAGFMAIGAYATALVASAIPNAWGFVLSLMVGMIISGGLALIVGIPTLRLRGDYLAIATLGVAEIIRIVIINLKITRGPAGIFGIPNFVNWQIVFGLSVVVIALIVNFVRSTTGQAIIAVRDNEIAAESLGINTTKYKVIAFVVGAMLAALAGRRSTGELYSIGFTTRLYLYAKYHDFNHCCLGRDWVDEWDRCDRNCLRYIRCYLAKFWSTSYGDLCGGLNCCDDFPSQRVTWHNRIVVKKNIV